MADQDYANMTDEDFMSMEHTPPVEEPFEEKPDVQPEEEPVVETETPEETDPEPQTEVEDDDDPVSELNPLGDDDDVPDAPLEATDDAEADPEAESEKPNDEADAEKPEEAEPEDKQDYKALYTAVMAPFKANGREVKVENPEEAIKLMQMGANYTKKLQGLQPNLRMMKMLENQGLLDEGKLTYLIDLHNKNPEAVKKLVGDSGIDPLDIDTDADPSYEPGKYAVTEEQMSFNNVLDEVATSDVGKETIVLINKEWDKASKDVIFKDPKILKVITQHKENGLYDQISSAVDKERMLGNLDGVPYINAYYQVGQAMSEQKLLKQQQQEAPVQHEDPVPTRQAVETRSAPRKKVSDNGEKAKAAGPLKAAPKTVKQDYNPLSMSDEEFEKSAEMAKRL